MDESNVTSMLIDDVSIALINFSAIAPQNGWWWNPAEGGRGFAIERQGNKIFLAAFLYETSGNATWYVSTLAQQGSGSYSGDLLRYSGGQTLLGGYKAPTSTSTVGTAILSFDSATTGTLDIQQADGSTVRSIAIERFPISTPAFATTAAHFESGWWWNEAQGGRGFFVEVQGTQAFIGGFMYDASGQPVWYVSTASLQGTQVVGGALQQYVGGQSLTGSYKSPTVLTSAVGNISFNLASNASGSMTLPNGSTVPVTRFNFNPNSVVAVGAGSPFAGTYTISTTGFTATFVVDNSGNISQCISGALLACSGVVSASGSFTIDGNDGMSPIDTRATLIGTISAIGGVTGTFTANSVSSGPLAGSFTGSRITILSTGAPKPNFKTEFDTCYQNTPSLYTTAYCTAYANARVAGSTPEAANQAGANAAGSNVGNIGTGQPVTSTGTPNLGGPGTTTANCLAGQVLFNGACAKASPALTFSRSELTFPAQANGTTSAAQTVSLTNTGNTGILLKRAMTLPLFAQWNVVNDTCPKYDGTVFAVGATCAISIVFTPLGDDNKLAAYTLQQSLGQNPPPIPNDIYKGVYEAWGDSVTSPQLPVPKATVLLNGSGVYPVYPTCVSPKVLLNGVCAVPPPVGVTGVWQVVKIDAFTNSQCLKVNGSSTYSMTLKEDAAGFVTDTSTTSGPRTGKRTGNTLNMSKTSTKWSYTVTEVWQWDGANKLTGTLSATCYNITTNVLIEKAQSQFTATRN
jgi:hypothetical protein